MPVEIAKPYLDPHAEELLAAIPAPRKALFLDRDGVINVDHGYVHKPEDTEWVPGIFKLCAEAQRAGYLLVVVTNQAGIARGYYSVEEFMAYTRWVHEQFALKGTPFVATYYCPHHPEFAPGCECRKPSPGMISAALADFEIEAMNCAIIGDKKTDLQAGLAAGLMKNRLIYSANKSLFYISRELDL
ncbi:MAG: HAD family hydrolase [Rhodanobacter sp.]|nr:MAG: HAD family hydrolase [Rhodanobacter sp.]